MLDKQKLKRASYGAATLYGIGVGVVVTIVRLLNDPPMNAAQLTGFMLGSIVAFPLVFVMTAAIINFAWRRSQ